MTVNLTAMGNEGLETASIREASKEAKARNISQPYQIEMCAPCLIDRCKCS